jgi:hypothetical protein
MDFHAFLFGQGVLDRDRWLTTLGLFADKGDPPLPRGVRRRP